MRRAKRDGSGIARQLSGIRPSRHGKVSYGDRQGALTFINSIGSFLLNAPLAQPVSLRHVRLRISTLRKFAKFSLPLTSYLFIRRECSPAPAEGGRGEIRCLTAIHWRSPALRPAKSTLTPMRSSILALCARPGAPRRA